MVYISISSTNHIELQKIIYVFKSGQIWIVKIVFP